MGRPLRHSRDDTVRRAMAVFWKNGFSGTSVRTLGNALDLRPGSIYASFGSKEKLYLEALRMYAHEHGVILSECFQQEPTFMRGFESFLHRVVSARDNPRTCMLGKTVSAFETGDRRIRGEAETLMEGLRSLLQREIEQASSRGELPTHCDSEALAQFMQVQLLGLRSYADACTDDRDLDALLQQSMRSIQACAGGVA